MTSKQLTRWSTATSTSSAAVHDRVLFTDAKTSIANEKTATVPTSGSDAKAMTAMTSPQTTSGTSSSKEPYRQSAHKVVVKRYAIKRG